MKKFFSFLLSLMLIWSALSAYAEEEIFSFRNGIHFGDSLEDVLSKETFEGETHVDSSGQYVLTYNGVMLSSISESVLEYYFKDNHLDFFLLIYGTQRIMNLNEKYHTTNYDTIEDGLISKYGEVNPEFSLDNIRTYYGCALNSVAKNEPENIVKWSHREIPTNDGSIVIIEHLLLGRPFYGTVNYGHYLSYKIADPEEDDDSVISDL